MSNRTRQILFTHRLRFRALSSSPTSAEPSPALLAVLILLRLGKRPGPQGSWSGMAGLQAAALTDGQTRRFGCRGLLRAKGSTPHGCAATGLDGSYRM
jgi:hypothetical protein